MMGQRRLGLVLVAIFCAIPTIATPRAAEAKDDGVRIERNLVYAKVGERELRVDLYVPPRSVSERPPLVVWIHGGGWRAGNKLPCPATFLLPRGYAVASVEYRFSQEAIYPAQAHDAKAAIRYLRGVANKHGYDATRIGVMGASAGGHLSMLLGTSAGVAALEGDLGEHDDESSRVQAVVNLFGPSDLVEFEAIDEMKPVAAKLVAQLLGGAKAETVALAKSASPVHMVTADDAPLLSIHGDRDKLVPLRQSRKIHAAYGRMKLDTTLHVVEGGNHGGPRFVNQAVQDRITRFFDERIETK